MYDRADGAGEAGAARGMARRVTRADLMRSAGLLGADYTFHDSGPAEEAVLEGLFDTLHLHLRPGLILHAAAVRDLRDLSTSNSLYPGIKIVVVIDGGTDLSFGHRRFALGPDSAGPGARAAGALVNLAETDCFSRRWQRGRHEKKVSLTLTPEWMAVAGLDAHGAPPALRTFLREHLACQPWMVSARARQLAAEILAPPSFLPGLQRLRLEGRCIALATEALARFAPAADAAPPLRAADRRRLARLEELLRSDAGAQLSMAAIARALGTNPSSLQSLTQREWGTSVFGRLRLLRMEQARLLLAGGAGVAQAARAAGYAAASNFATAFKKQYGVSPRHAHTLR
ncbi:helix-turn-helix domain-containing protein [Massilia sp. DJPM01]|uniref:helix-turn-helix transcriptional regulator n=1 Tax=Massilia sp. DJPM01 TaxID=3024404 RepID=UPI00259DB85B|nr:helix-turn-helix domain-containing protein [Massilia sp. DJPM01]MDM5180797.1 helix-turn-helix domain-containing protein [Massilia sp. DJPM01]